MSKGLCLALRHQIHQGRHASVEVFLRRPRRHPEAVAIYADATLWAAQLLPGQTIRHELVPGRGAYLVAARGSYCIGELRVQARDGLAVTGEPAVEIAVLEPLEVLLLELAMS